MWTAEDCKKAEKVTTALKEETVLMEKAGYPEAQVQSLRVAIVGLSIESAARLFDIIKAA